MNLKDWLNLILTLAILTALYFLWVDSSNNAELMKRDLKQYWQERGFKTDTIKVDVDYTKLPRPKLEFKVPPAQVITFTPANVDWKAVELRDSLLLVIDSLENHIYTINTLFLKIEPTAPKLLYAEFKFDSIRLDLLSTQGRVYSSRVATDYANFQYQFQDGEFRASAVKPRSKNLHALLYSYVGYGTKPVIGADYFLYKNKWRLGADARLYISEQPLFYINGTIGYKLYGN
jgi:hypothetical protein